MTDFTGFGDGMFSQLNSTDFKHMDKVRDRLWLGSWAAADRRDDLLRAGITTVICVAHDSPARVYPEFRNVRFAYVDGKDQPHWMIEAATCALELAWRMGEHVLIHCHAGQSRSVFVLARMLARVDGRPVPEIYPEIAKARPGIIVWEKCIWRKYYPELWEYSAASGR